MHFREALRPPAICLGDSHAFLGRWISLTRTLEIARGLLAQPWGAVLEVLKHEIAHQYVDEVLGIRDETAHGPAFRTVCATLGIDAAASGLPRDPTDPGEERSRVLERITKLLALAESPNPHEAEAAMAAAQRLLLKHNLEVGDSPRARQFVHRHLGSPSGRVQEPERVLASLLGSHFFVEPLWVSVWIVERGMRGTVLEVCGTRENVEIAEYVYSFLLHTAERLWRDHKRRVGARGDADRRRFLAGVMSGFRAKLDAQREQTRAEGLVWVGDGELEAYFRRRHPRIRSIASRSSARSSAFAQGRAAGATIVLHRGVRAGPTSGAKLLRGQ
ncbi:MAG: DUF2786 domain-containing protein [Polyangiaceae bacterium]|nr:DUF2786 domain-containing protein [Polyangiaceae bacterium]